MKSADRESLFAGLSAETAGLTAELRALMDARWRLLRLELVSARDQLRTLAIVLVVASCAGLTSLPVFIVAAGDALDGTLGLPRWAWLLASGLVLLAGAILVAWSAWRRFRREFAGLTESVEELREDLVWLREWRTEPCDDKHGDHSP